MIRYERNFNQDVIIEQVVSELIFKYKPPEFRVYDLNDCYLQYFLTMHDIIFLFHDIENAFNLPPLWLPDNSSRMMLSDLIMEINVTRPHNISKKEIERNVAIITHTMDNIRGEIFAKRFSATKRISALLWSIKDYQLNYYKPPTRYTKVEHVKFYQ